MLHLFVLMYPVSEWYHPLWCIHTLYVVGLPSHRYIWFPETKTDKMFLQWQIKLLCQHLIHLIYGAFSLWHAHTTRRIILPCFKTGETVPHISLIFLFSCIYPQHKAANILKAAHFLFSNMTWDYAILFTYIPETVQQQSYNLNRISWEWYQ